MGRPSNTGAADLLAALLAPLDPSRPVVVGENDAKPDGLWPGKEGRRGRPRSWPGGWAGR